ncbi:MAG: hypothetical protein FWC46_09705 [Actinomycetia bacterium]|nr:hypothetical protein [Actinomycetes bacterium]
MSAAGTDAPRATPRRTEPKAPSTSIRVSVPTRDALAHAAAAQNLSLSGYLDKMVRRAEREQIFADYRAAAEEAYQDPAFAAEMKEWDETDDGVPFDDDGWPEYSA